MSNITHNTTGPRAWKLLYSAQICGAKNYDWINVLTKMAKAYQMCLRSAQDRPLQLFLILNTIWPLIKKKRSLN